MKAAENWSPPISKTFEQIVYFSTSVTGYQTKKIWSKITGLKANYNRFLINWIKIYAGLFKISKKLINLDFQFFSFKKTIVVTLKTFEQIFWQKLWPNFITTLSLYNLDVYALNQTFWSKMHYSYDFKVKTHFNFVPCHFMECLKFLLNSNITIGQEPMILG